MENYIEKVGVLIMIDNENNDKNSFVMYKSHWDTLQELPAENLKKVMQAIFSLVDACEMPELDLVERLTFKPIKHDIDLATEKWQKKRNWRKEAGRKGGLAKAENAKAKEPKTSASKKEVDEHFEELWKLYPIKRGKTSVSDATKKKLLEVDVEKMKIAIKRYEDEVSNASFEQSYMNGSTWFNGRYKDYIADDFAYIDRPDEDYDAMKDEFLKVAERVQAEKEIETAIDEPDFLNDDDFNY